MSTRRKNPRNASTSVGRLEGDLKNAENLLNAWAGDPAGVFVQYGIASDKRDVTVNKARAWCASACAFTVEIQFEVSKDPVPATLDTVD